MYFTSTLFSKYTLYICQYIGWCGCCYLLFGASVYISARPFDASWVFFFSSFVFVCVVSTRPVSSVFYASLFYVFTTECVHDGIARAMQKTVERELKLGGSRKAEQSVSPSPCTSGSKSPRSRAVAPRCVGPDVPPVRYENILFAMCHI